jgi:hypothetical protein
MIEPLEEEGLMFKKSEIFKKISRNLDNVRNSGILI